MVPASAQKTVLITGCSLGGIGDALAQSFYYKGLRVFATARDLSKIQHLKEMGMTVLALDAVDTLSIKGAVESVQESTAGTLDILVNNAGIGYSSPILDADLGYARKVMEVNLFPRVAITQAFTPLLIRSKGTIVNIGSIAGVYPPVWQGMYGASCAAVHHWSDILRNEMEPFDVKVILARSGLTSLTICQLRNEIEAVMNTKAVRNNFVDVRGYARQVVSNVLKSTPKRRQWAGGVANLIWIASTFLWPTAWDFLIADQWGLKVLKRKLKSKQ